LYDDLIFYFDICHLKQDKDIRTLCLFVASGYSRKICG